MFQLLDVKPSIGRKLGYDFTVLLDDTKVTNGVADSAYVVTLSYPLPTNGQSLDSYIQEVIVHAMPGLTSTLNSRNSPPVDPFSKWKGYKFGK